MMKERRVNFVYRDDPSRVYQDRKRYGWLAAFISPGIGIATVVSFVATQNAVLLFLPLVYALVFIPLLDAAFGEDANNPPDEVLPAMAQDNYYRILLYVDIGLLFCSFACFAWLIGTQSLSWWAYLAATLSASITSADAIFIGHELGHKRNKADRMAAQTALALVGYGHFNVEHNRGHHVHVATPEDSASSRMGESVYRFALREIPGAVQRGWRLEAQRLAALKLSAWSRHNEILQSWILTGVIALVVVAAFGWQLLPFLVLHHLYAWYALTQANYVEHYGLLREKLPNGRYELPQPKHSWNTNHVFSNLVTFHLQRHSDHHANALRPYQALRDFADLPRLPSGYPGCFGLAMIPSLWFKTMDAKLLEWCAGDLSKINIDPAQRERLFAKYGISLDPVVAFASAVTVVPALRAAFTMDLEATGEFPVPDPIPELIYVDRMGGEQINRAR
jgi:alkane 1-monooxygenase